MMPATVRNADTRLTDAFNALFKNNGVKYGYYTQANYHGTAVFLYQAKDDKMWREGTKRGTDGAIVTVQEATTAAVGIDCSNSFQQAGLKAGFNWSYKTTSGIVNGSGDLTSAGAQCFVKIEGLNLSPLIDKAKGENYPKGAIDRIIRQLVVGDILMFNGHIGIYAGAG